MKRLCSNHYVTAVNLLIVYLSNLNTSKKKERKIKKLKIYPVKKTKQIHSVSARNKHTHQTSKKQQKIIIKRKK